MYTNVWGYVVVYFEADNLKQQTIPPMPLIPWQGKYIPSIQV